MAIVAVAALGGSQYVTWPSWPGGHAPAVARTCAAVVKALKSDDMAALDRFCADGETGKSLLAADNQRLLNGSAVHAATVADDPQAGMSCFDFLKNARRQLADQGIAPAGITPVAFGGVEAKILDPATMSNPATSITGELYFKAGDKLYAIELTARKCGEDFVVTGFWRCQPLDVPAEDLKAYARKKYDQQETAPTGGAAIKISRIHRLYVPLPTTA